jgi:hypothetical protein
VTEQGKQINVAISQKDKVKKTVKRRIFVVKLGAAQQAEVGYTKYVTEGCEHATLYNSKKTS